MSVLLSSFIQPIQLEYTPARVNIFGEAWAGEKHFRTNPRLCLTVVTRTSRDRLYPEMRLAIHVQRYMCVRTHELTHTRSLAAVYVALLAIGMNRVQTRSECTPAAVLVRTPTLTLEAIHHAWWLLLGISS